MLSKVVNGFREPTTELRLKIADILQSDEAWLFERPENMPVHANPNISLGGPDGGASRTK